MQKVKPRKTKAVSLFTFDSYIKVINTMLKNIYISIIASVTIGALLWALVDYFTLPIVAFNQDGECVYIDTEQGRQACDIIPNKYIKERVK